MHKVVKFYRLLYFGGQVHAERSQLSVNGYALTGPSQKFKRMWKNLLFQAQGSISKVNSHKMLHCTLHTVHYILL